MNVLSGHLIASENKLFLNCISGMVLKDSSKGETLSKGRASAN